MDGHLVARKSPAAWWLQNVTLTDDDQWLAKGAPQKAPEEELPSLSPRRNAASATLSSETVPAALCPEVQADDDLAYRLRPHFSRVAGLRFN